MRYFFDICGRKKVTYGKGKIKLNMWWEIDNLLYKYDKIYDMIFMIIKYM